MDFKNLKQFIPGYHSITGHETIRIQVSIGATTYSRFCQAYDEPLSPDSERTFILADTKRQFIRWRFPLIEGAIIQDHLGTYQVKSIEYSPTCGRNLHSVESGTVICHTTQINPNGLSESEYIFGILHQMNIKELEANCDTLPISGIMKSSGNPSVKEFKMLSFSLPQTSSYDKAFVVLTPNSEIVRKNLLLGPNSRIDEHGDHYNVCEIDYALRPTYPFLLTTEYCAIA